MPVRGQDGTSDNPFSGVPRRMSNFRLQHPYTHSQSLERKYCLYQTIAARDKKSRPCSGDGFICLIERTRRPCLRAEALSFEENGV